MHKNPLKQFLDCRPSIAEALSLAEIEDSQSLIHVAAQIRDNGHGNIISYSRKIFIPLTKLCRDFCYYCTFAEGPKKQGLSLIHI